MLGISERMARNQEIKGSGSSNKKMSSDVKNISGIIERPSDDIFLFEDPLPFISWFLAILSDIPSILWNSVYLGSTITEATESKMREIVVSYCPQPQ
jgi:hypothetical protein